MHLKPTYLCFFGNQVNTNLCNLARCDKQEINRHCMRKQKFKKMNSTLNAVDNQSSQCFPNRNLLMPTNGEDGRKYLCSICNDILKNPVLLGPCGHRTCVECAKKLLERCPPRCPFDENVINKEHVVQDKVLQKLLEHLSVKCFHNGCQWTGIYIRMLIHQQNCPYRPVSCPLECGETEIPRKLLEQHMRECLGSFIECPSCLEQVKKCDIDIHKEKLCLELLVECPNNCGVINKIPRKMLEQHFEEQCITYVMKCPFVKAGCQFKGRRNSLESHELEKYEEHLKLVSSAINDASEDRRDETGLLKSLSSMKMRTKLLSCLYEGQFFWKIGNFFLNFEEAQKVSHEELKSHIFCSSKLGYRLQLSTSLFGRGTRQGEYMSMMAQLCSGEYDELLSWPFRHQVAVTLLDQCDAVEKRKHLKCFLDPAKPSNDNGFQVFGTETFAKISDVFLQEHYIKDDAISLLIEVLDD